VAKRKSKAIRRRSPGYGDLGMVRVAGVHPLIFMGLGGALMLAAWRWKDLTSGGGMIVDAAKEQIFKAIIYAGARPYADVILAAARDQSVDPFVPVALGQRESGWGATLKNGTGDFTLRTLARAQKEGYTRVRSVAAAPAGWALPKDSKGAVIPGPYAMPEDGLGWGRGIMQVDWPRAQKMNWADPYSNIREGIRIYKEKLSYLSGKVSDTDLQAASIAAYNLGEGTVWSLYKSGGMAAVDARTTDKYAAGTTALLADLYSKFQQATA
jgi:hypothetical protein